MPDGGHLEPAGWNRIQLQVDNLSPRWTPSEKQVSASETTSLSGRAGKQILVDDPAGNPIELFEPPGQ